MKNCLAFILDAFQTINDVSGGGNLCGVVGAYGL
jgi:hypothetical protein